MADSVHSENMPEDRLRRPISTATRSGLILNLVSALSRLTSVEDRSHPTRQTHQQSHCLAQPERIADAGLHHR